MRTRIVTSLTTLCLGLASGPAGIAAAQSAKYVLGAPLMKQADPKDKKPKNCNNPHPCPTAAPVATADSATTAEDSPVTIGVLANDTGLEDGGIVVTVVTGPANGAAAANADGSITYSPSPEFSGSDSFTYSVTDVDGDTATAVVSVQVSPAPDAPVAAADSQTTSEDFPVAIQVLLNDSDPDGDAFTLTGVGAPAYGTAAMNADGSVQYSPAPNATAPDSFTYTITDATGLSSTGVVTISITAVDDPARARSDGPFTTAMGSAITINVLANDSLADGFGSVSLETPPGAGTAVLNADNTFTYTPDPTFSGRDYFSYIVRDIDGDASLAYVVIDVL